MTILTKQIGKPLTPPKNFFKWCERQIPTYEWRNKEQTISASDRTDCQIIKKRLTKKSRLTFPEKIYPFAIILVSKNRIEIQSYDYWRHIKDGKESLTRRLTNFERFENGKHLKAHQSNHQWYEGLLTNYGYMSGAYTHTIFYPNHWQDKFNINKDMKYVELPKIDRYDLARIYKKRLEIEYLQNIGATILADELITNGYIRKFGAYHRKVDMRVITLKWLKANKHVLKTTNPSFNQVMLENILRKRKVKPVKNIQKYVHYSQIKQLPKEVNLTHFQKWIIKQDMTFSYYLDYLRMLAELNIPLNHTNVSLPKDLAKAHDNAVKMINQLNMEKQAKQREKEEQDYQERFNKLLKLEKEIDEFVFLIPKELQEIIQEGSALHHCVGSPHYLEDHKKGATNIIFIRKKEDVATPYFTMEYKQQKVMQIQGKANRENVPSEVTLAVNKWQQEIKHII